MALQGTLESFALPDVLRLLASTGKTGILQVTTPEESGELILVDGELAGASAARALRATEPCDVLFELLRNREGSFLFDTDTPVDPPEGPRSDVESALAAAEEQLTEWREIEARVPSMRRPIELVVEREGQDITLTAEQWRTVVHLVPECTVAELGERLELPDLPVARLVRDLIDLGAIILGDTDIESIPEVPEASYEPELASEPGPAVSDHFSGEETPAFEPIAEVSDDQAHQNDSWTTDTFAGSSFDAFDPNDESGISGLPPLPGAPSTNDFGSEPSFAPGTDDPESLAPVAPLFGRADSNENGPLDGDPLADDPFGPDPFTLPRLNQDTNGEEFIAGSGADDDSEATEMARQLANLSPRAAQAVAAAAAATTEEEREEALAQAEEDSTDPVNRNLLLRFLSSVEE